MKTGYEISYYDFLRLCSDHRAETAPLLRAWFGYEIVPGERDFELRDVHGAALFPASVHAVIQADPEHQGTIYRVAMTLWR
ncbi:hypothetical protein [Paludibaculum fermentans]|uniref:Uncharacterized protein n=1 Tax=Paludibaculum fermentans TaxID=1473598 RepID=A0A7S7SKQ4_PALFE|nr:hypothetical protein [Paludibaculum fermentans]QOY87666.1 hypothetical protein IRI77_33770 [Paludibaculum fermentans]